ncbi:MAG: dTMP kinase [Candidatus Bathyarchaeota archaeon]|nr:dTMP kinase [Candidatus Bathyarchaeota archaeon]
MKRKGCFICIEGLDGCGKTTQTKILVRKLRKLGYDAVYTSEPSKSRIGRFIRSYCLQGRQRESPVVEALLFAADRVEHLRNEVIPALDRRQLVVSDRYLYSSLAYQGAAGLDLKWIETLNANALSPDLAIFIDIDPCTAIRRLKPKKSVMENLETQQKVREVYVKYVEKGKLIMIDGNDAIEKVSDNILDAVKSFLKNLS